MVRDRGNEAEVPMLMDPVLTVSRATPSVTTDSNQTGLAPSSDKSFRLRVDRERRPLDSSCLYP